MSATDPRVGGVNTIRPKMMSEELGRCSVGGLGDEGSEEEEVDVSEDRRVPMKLQNPRLPTQAEIDEHTLTHLPFRSWCRHCV